MSTPPHPSVTVTFTRDFAPNGEVADDHLTLGPYPQGVCIEPLGLEIVDVATRGSIAVLHDDRWALTETEATFDRAFVQAVPT